MKNWALCEELQEILDDKKKEARERSEGKRKAEKEVQEEQDDVDAWEQFCQITKIKYEYIAIYSNTIIYYYFVMFMILGNYYWGDPQ